jgi:intracellular sulfur oxidation DsrE/DsrF family protein
MKHALALVLFLLMAFAALQLAAQPEMPSATIIPEADGYVTIPSAAMPPDLKRTYRAIYDATLAASAPSQLVPALNMAGSELNAFGAAGLSRSNAQFAVVFHGPAVDGILTDSCYQAKFGMANPNLSVLKKMKALGVELFVCGQYLMAEHIDPRLISPDVTVASDALIVLMACQNDGYALMSF